MKITQNKLAGRQFQVAIVSCLFILTYALAVNLFNFPANFGGNMVVMICSLFLGKMIIEKIHNFKFKETIVVGSSHSCKK